MKKMTKGAIVTGLGVALLLGGGGTLATWNMNESASAGAIQSGELGLNVTNPTPWTSKITGTTVAANHKIIPGEVLTYQQTVVVKKQGNGLSASLKVIGMDQVVNGAFNQNAFGKTLTPTVTVTDPSGTDIPLDITALYNKASSTLDSDAKPGEYKVKATVAFHAEGKQDMNAAINLDTIRFQLEQNKISTN